MTVRDYEKEPELRCQLHDHYGTAHESTTSFRDPLTKNIYAHLVNVDGRFLNLEL